MVLPAITVGRAATSADVRQTSGTAARTGKRTVPLDMAAALGNQVPAAATSTTLSAAHLQARGAVSWDSCAGQRAAWEIRETSDTHRYIQGGHTLMMSQAFRADQDHDYDDLLPHSRFVNDSCHNQGGDRSANHDTVRHELRYDLERRRSYCHQLCNFNLLQQAHRRRVRCSNRLGRNG